MKSQQNIIELVARPAEFGGRWCIEEADVVELVSRFFSALRRLSLAKLALMASLTSLGLVLATISSRAV